MSGTPPVRNQDGLLSPGNAIISFIDYQPDPYAGVGSVAVDERLVKVITLGKIATAHAAALGKARG